MVPPSSSQVDLTLQQFRDYFGKGLVRRMPHLITVMEPRSTFEADLHINLFWNTIEYFPDHLVRIILNRALWPWTELPDEVTGGVWNTEFVDKLRLPSLTRQLRIYRALIRLQLLGETPVIMHHVVVIGSVSRKGRRIRFFLDVDSHGKPIYVYVHYLDELHLERLPAADLESPLGQLLMAIHLDSRSPAMTRRAVAAVLREPDSEQRQELLKFIRCIVNIWVELRDEFEDALTEEVSRMPAIARNKLLRENVDSFVAFPGHWEIFTEKYIAPVRTKSLKQGKEQGLKQGKEQGQAKERRAVLLTLLRARGIRLSAPLRAKLNRLPLDQLPPIELANEAESAADFAERAGLTNGRG